MMTMLNQVHFTPPSSRIELKKTSNRKFIFLFLFFFDKRPLTKNASAQHKKNRSFLHMPDR